MVDPLFAVTVVDVSVLTDEAENNPVDELMEPATGLLLFHVIIADIGLPYWSIGEAVNNCDPFDGMFIGVGDTVIVVSIGGTLSTVAVAVPLIDSLVAVTVIIVSVPTDEAENNPVDELMEPAAGSLIVHVMVADIGLPY